MPVKSDSTEYGRRLGISLASIITMGLDISWRRIRNISLTTKLSILITGSALIKVSLIGCFANLFSRRCGNNLTITLI